MDDYKSSQSCIYKHQSNDFIEVDKIIDHGSIVPKRKIPINVNLVTEQWSNEFPNLFYKNEEKLTFSSTVKHNIQTTVNNAEFVRTS